jgi:acetyl esterase
MACRSIWRAQGQALRLLLYKPKTGAQAESAPILLYIHGGGFSIGDRFESGTNLRWFADRGGLALSIDYTLSSIDRHLWDTSTSQVACALAWTATNAARLESSCGGTVPRVSAVSALYPPVDLAAAWVSQVPAISDMARQFNTYYVGGSPQQFPDRYRYVASASHINAAAPPTLVIFGAHDHLVPPDATDCFAQQDAVQASTSRVSASPMAITPSTSFSTVSATSSTSV